VGATSSTPTTASWSVLTGEPNDLAVVRAWFRLFTGTRHVSTVSLTVGPRERFAVLAVAALTLGGGVYPQPGVTSRHRAAAERLHERENRAGRTDPAPDRLAVAPGARAGD
jgi:NADH-quinone oxidoreductase subunit M